MLYGWRKGTRKIMKKKLKEGGGTLGKKTNQGKCHGNTVVRIGCRGLPFLVGKHALYLKGGKPFPYGDMHTGLQKPTLSGRSTTTGAKRKGASLLISEWRKCESQTPKATVFYEEK